MNIQHVALMIIQLNIKYEEILFEMIRSYFDEYEMVIQKKHNHVLEKFKKNMMYLDSHVNLLFPDGNLQNISFTIFIQNFRNIFSNKNKIRKVINIAFRSRWIYFN